VTLAPSLDNSSVARAIKIGVYGTPGLPPGLPTRQGQEVLERRRKKVKNRTRGGEGLPPGNPGQYSGPLGGGTIEIQGSSTPDVFFPTKELNSDIPGRARARAAVARRI
jgi:hypothetical protein